MKHFICIAVVLFSFVGYQQAAEVLPIVLKGHTNPIYFAVFSPDGKTILTACRDHATNMTVRIWDTETGTELRQLGGFTINSAVFSADGTKVITCSGSNTVPIWDAESGKVLQELEGHIDRITSARFSPDGKKVLTGSADKTVRMWDAESGKELWKIEGHTPLDSAGEFSPAGKMVITSSADNVVQVRTFRIWDTDSGKELQKFKEQGSQPRFAVFSPDEKKIVIASQIGLSMFGIATYDDKVAKIWDAESGKVLQKLEGHTDGVLCAFFSPDSKKIITSSIDNTARIWDAETGKELQKLEGYVDMGLLAVFSSNGRKVLARGLSKSSIRVWDAESGKELQIFHPFGNLHDISPDGRKAVTIGWNRDDNIIAKIWDLEQSSPP